MDFIHDSQQIAGVQIARLASYGDDRGKFQEIFRRSWFPQMTWERLQSNCSHSQAGVLRGLHYHFHQVDYWYVPHGRIRAALYDMRPSSSTYGKCQTIEMGGDNNIGLYIPIGVAHGFYAVTDCTLIYFVSNYYDSTDEYGVHWNDPNLGIVWGADDPTLSDRDLNNPLLKDITPENMPK